MLALFKKIRILRAICALGRNNGRIGRETKSEEHTRYYFKGHHCAEKFWGFVSTKKVAFHVRIF
jgi:hypothetical protein